MTVGDLEADIADGQHRPPLQLQNPATTSYAGIFVRIWSEGVDGRQPRRIDTRRRL